MNAQSFISTEMEVRGRNKSAQDARNRKRAVIVDDHPITRSGLAHLINHQPDLQLSGEADNASKALLALDDMLCSYSSIWPIVT